jgi:RimJ/RimL family protein N-acetyltransferase
VCAALTVTAATPLRVRHARLEDEALLLDWANDPTTRRNAFFSELISAETHRNWFRARLRDPECCRLYVLETEDRVPVGQVRFDRLDQTWRVDYALARHFRGRGLGRPLLEAALRKLGEEQPCASVVGQVKENNAPSRKVFESLSFDAHANGGGAVEYRRVL